MIGPHTQDVLDLIDLERALRAAEERERGLGVALAWRSERIAELKRELVPQGPWALTS